jgi:hypothetical protein
MERETEWERGNDKGSGEHHNSSPNIFGLIKYKRTNITPERNEKKGEVVAVLNQAHAMKTYGAVEIQLYAF